MSGAHEAHEIETAKEGEPVVRVSASFPWHSLAVVAGGLLASATGGGVWYSHGSVSSKLDQVLESQHALELKFAKLEAQTDRLRELDEQVRRLQSDVAELRGGRDQQRERGNR